MGSPFLTAFSAAGEVFLATEAATGRQVAVKKMELQKDNTKLLITEIQIMKTSRHRSIVEYFDSFAVGTQLWVVMEFMDGGCLTDILEAFQTVQLSEEHIAYICREVRCSTYRLSDLTLPDACWLGLHSFTQPNTQRYQERQHFTQQRW